MYIFEIVVASVSIVIWGILLGMSFDIRYPSYGNFWTGGGSFPFVIALLLIILNLIWIVDSVKNLKSEKHLGTEPEKEKTLFGFLFGTKEQSKNLFIIFSLTVCYVFALIPIAANINRTYGFAAATLIFLTVSIKIFGKLSWVKTVLTSTITTGIVFFAMDTILRLPMPK